MPIWLSPSLAVGVEMTATRSRRRVCLVRKAGRRGTFGPGHRRKRLVASTHASSWSRGWGACSGRCHGADHCCCGVHASWWFVRRFVRRFLEQPKTRFRRIWCHRYREPACSRSFRRERRAGFHRGRLGNVIVRRDSRRDARCESHLWANRQHLAPDGQRHGNVAAGARAKTHHRRPVLRVPQLQRMESPRGWTGRRFQF